MPRFLLLGAGFSKNWGGWLASEVADDLIWRLRHKRHLAETMMEKGFEDAFHDLSSAFSKDSSFQDDYQSMKEAIYETFRAMNEGYAARLFLDFSNEFSIHKFLSKFDVIFTLNQDMLLEIFYLRWNVVPDCRWAGPHWPGVEEPDFSPGISEDTRKMFVTVPWSVKNVSPEIDRDRQPIIKLHGSINWAMGQEHSPNAPMVIGGNKEEAISSNPLLDFYSNYFKNKLLEKDALLMTIGYSFNDAHINKAILAADNAPNNFGLFIVDPNGRKILDKRDPRAAITQPIRDQPLMNIRYIGGSSRPLVSTFSGDYLEHAKLQRFFEE